MAMSPLFAFMGIGSTELLVVGVVVVLLFGHRLPSLMRSLGRGVTEFKSGLNTDPEDAPEDDVKEAKEAKK